MPALLRLRSYRKDSDWLVGHIRSGGRAVVALSGGVDSAVVAWLAFRALPHDAEAVTLTGSAVSAEEHRTAVAAAAAIGIPLASRPADPIVRSEYRANRDDRCYYCRQVETEEVLRYGRERGARQYLDGVHLDDLGDDRPGLRAMDQAGFTHPLAEAGWSKYDVRQFAREVGLPNWDRPSNACLASRVEHGIAIDPELLARIERAEEAIRSRGFRQVRVRFGAQGARVEVGKEEVDRLLAPSLRSDVERHLTALGFDRVSIDPEGYRGRSGT